jgi:hypothetical protein
MGDYRLIGADDQDAWHDALAGCGEYDSYHLPGYHRLARELGEGEPRLFVFEEGGRSAALPFLLRSVDRVEGLEDCQHRDAVSVYGFPGLLSSVQRQAREADRFRRRFQEAFREALESLGAVALFVRQNPLIDSSWLFDSAGEVIDQGTAVAIDLTRTEEEQQREMRRGHRYDVRAARKAGMTVREDRDLGRIELFRGLYEETMDRVGAARHYYFPIAYYENLKRQMADHVKLMFCEQQGEVIGGALFFATGRIIQYHLSGTAARFSKQRGAAKLILDHVRSWGSRRGFSWFHLGGGLGGRRDSLFAFKSGFSKTRLAFQTVRAVIRPDIYRELVRRRVQWEREHLGTVSQSGYFPEYRRPAPVIDPNRAAA